METLRITFDPWKEKIVFVEKYLSDVNTSQCIILDNLIDQNISENYFIKMDIEGFEIQALKGAENLLSGKSHIKMDICTYHNFNDFNDISNIVKNHGFNFISSDSYLLYFGEKDIPNFRKALLRADNRITCLN